MDNLKKFIIIFLLLLQSCSSTPQKVESIIEEKDLDQQMIAAYNEGLNALKKGDVYYAGKKFNEAELLYPQSEWAAKAVLMASYGYYTQAYYNSAADELNRFIIKYPKNPNLDYAYYLLAMCHYESIVDEKKDLKPLLYAKDSFNLVIEKFPLTDFAIDAKYKLGLINDLLAAKEMYIARHYIKKEKWIAAVNRLKVIVEDYDTTIYIEEALHRLVEIHYKLGLVSEAKKYANTLGYNYLSSQWYKESYRVFNKNYKIERKTSKKDKKRLRDRIKSFF
jgi:outer membrane protein assembly factor BamD|tara:strand:- start:2171 stop:3004 length:834 start_codon:yes stop_codon:yes gene_type:complete